VTGSKIEVHGRNSECVERLCGRVSVTLTTAIKRSKKVRRTSGLVLLTPWDILRVRLGGASHPDIPWILSDKCASFELYVLASFLEIARALS
jgi:hypothetical protein